jgi:hypothetical protein
MNYQLPDYKRVNTARTNANLITNNGVDKCHKHDYKEGIADFNAALRFDPNHPFATYNKGVAMIAWGYKQVLDGHSLINGGMNGLVKTSDMRIDAIKELASSLEDEFRSLRYLD